MPACNRLKIQRRESNHKKRIMTHQNRPLREYSQDTNADHAEFMRRMYEPAKLAPSTCHRVAAALMLAASIVTLLWLATKAIGGPLLDDANARTTPYREVVP